jgi:autotransporter strand-loop-strand O-heptosyltransferase
MNYYVTHCDSTFLKYAERLFETLSIFSDYKIIFYTVDFDYKSKFNNVICIRYDSRKNNRLFDDYSLNTAKDDSYKAFNVFFKPFIVDHLLNIQKYNNDNFCYLDADCLATLNCDNIFKQADNIIDYPLMNRCCYEYLIMNGAGDPFIGNSLDLNLTLESKLIKFLNYDLNSRKQYVQTGVFLFNNKCLDFIKQWCEICSIPEIIKNWKIYTPFHEETVANCILWKKDKLIDLSQSLINLPYNTENYDLSFQKIKEMMECLSNARYEKYFLQTWCLIPAKNDLKNLFFYHGKVSDNEYNYIKDYMTNNYLLKIHSQSLGDTIAATPTLRKLYNSYNKKIDVITHHPDLFKNNKYVDKIYSFSDSINEKFYKETFNTFLGVGGEKNKYGVEKKHNTIDIRQFHAIDLGFTLNEKEMEYDYIPDAYIEIENLPNDYVCLHVANTWPSRTYSDENWQILINKLNNKNIPVVLIGKNGNETGFFNVDKPTKKLNFKKGLDLTNKLSISQCWHVINKSKYFVTMDSGLLHLAGTTDTEILQLGSSINNKLRAPYRNNSQSYKYKYISGSCDIFCASDIKYGVKEWKTIQGIPPLIKCLEDKSSFECHPSPQLIIDCISFDEMNNSKNEKKKFLFITPHLSTGGSPKYLEWLISDKIKESYEIKVIEWNLYSWQYNVQRNSVIELVGEDNFISLGSYENDSYYFSQKEKEVIELINKFQPNYIHLNEVAENFAIKGMSDNFLSLLYDKNRKYEIYETSHAKNTVFKDKRFMPDEFWPVIQYHYDIIKSFTDNVRLVECDLSKNIRPDRNKTLISLGLNPNYFHVLQVGLFNKNKNQKYTFDLAKNLIDKKVQFHFVGNLCYIDECNIDKQQINCKIWGERNDVDIFMSCMDLFIMPSFEELNPIALKEAISWDMKCFINDWPTIQNKYRNINNVEFISKNNVQDHINSKAKPLLNNFKFTDVENNNIICTYFPTPKIEILGNDDCFYNIKFLDKDTGILHYETNLNVNMWTSCSIEYYCNWKIIVKNLNTNLISEFNHDLDGKRVKIVNESASLGDSISWIAAINEFQKNHNCKIDYYGPRKFLFESEYPNINFYNYSDVINADYYSQYKIGCFAPDNKNLSRTDWRNSNLQEIAFDILGLTWKEVKTKIKIPNKLKLPFDKYVCIAIQSTSQSRYWNNDDWKTTVSYLKSLGYKVVCVDKNYSFGIEKYFNVCPDNVDYFAGEHSLDEIIDIINNCEFFIGLSSGLSWISWALNKKIIKINNSVNPNFEFSNDYIVQNKFVCTNCFTNKKYIFNAKDWAWCPENKNFECSKSISFDMMKTQIDLLINNINAL